MVKELGNLRMIQLLNLSTINNRGRAMAKINSISEKEQLGVVTNILASVCHNCEICPYANRKPNSAFEKLMRWHRKWCPAWAAHAKVYGVKSLTQ
jgi:hypothetical protein